MKQLRHALTWFEVPVTDFERAKKFYETILACTMLEWSLGGVRMAMFPCATEDGAVGGAITLGGGSEPSVQGTHVYLWCPEGVEAILERVAAAGGAVLQPKQLITPEIGYCAHIRDSEGNKVGLHTRV